MSLWRSLILCGSTVALVASVPAPAAAKAKRGAPAKKEARPTPPPGFVEMFVAGVMPSPDGHTLFLNDKAKKYFIPMGIGATEALSIHYRLERRRFERPLTHDLYDATLRELGGRLIKVHVDDLRSGVFTGTVFVKAKSGRLFTIDSRPSDAIALALGSRVPIFVARSVIDEAAISSDQALEEPADPELLPESMPRPAEAAQKPISM